MKSYEKPTNSEVDAAVALLGPLANQQYFFDRLNNPLWIGPLRDRGVFKHPFEPTRDGSVLRSTPWPASRYLAKMAGTAPREVAEIPSSLTTANWTIARDILEAAMVMPPEHAIKLVPKLKELMSTSFFSHDVRDLGTLCAKLADGGYPDAGVDLLRVVLHFDWDETHRRADQDTRWLIESVTKDAIPALIQVRPAEVIEHLVGEVSRAVRASKHPPSDADDHSWIWRPAIEDHEQNHDFD